MSEDCGMFNRKRYRKEMRGKRVNSDESGNASAEDDTDSFSKISPTRVLLKDQRVSVALKRLYKPPPGHKDASEPSLNTIPDFKVGTLEMYHRFPEAYDALMACHDCSSIRDFFVDTVYPRIIKSVGETQNKEAFIRVADFGCGTGRIECMVATLPQTRAIYAYDLETPMLRVALVKTATQVVRQCDTVPADIQLVDTASVPEVSSPVSLKELLEEGNTSNRMTNDTLDRRILDICMRPCSFQHVQRGFLSKTHHRKCHVVVSAWALSYVQRAAWAANAWHDAVDTIIAEMISLLDNSESDAVLVIVETLGSASAEPSRNSTLTERLQSVHGMQRQWVRTDYHFPNRKEGEKAIRFFFGPKVVASLQDDTASDASAVTLMECTGIWTYWKPRAQQ